MPDDLVAELRSARTSWPLSTLVAALPVLTLFFVLLVLRARVWVAALAGMLGGGRRWPWSSSGCRRRWSPAAWALGVSFGLLRGSPGSSSRSIFLYDVAVETGQFQVMKDSIAALSSDRRLQLILIAFCFGAFLEGTGGGGAPVAIAGSFLIGLGFDPFQAATLCLVANTAPVAWGGGRQPDPRAGGRDRPARAGAQRHGRPDPAAAVGDPAALAGAEHGRLARDAARSGRRCWSAACRSPRCSSTGRTTRSRAWSTSSPRWSRCWRWSAFLKVWRPSDDRSVTNPAGRPAARRHGRVARDHALGGRAEGLVAVPAGLGLHLPLRPSRRSPGT